MGLRNTIRRGAALPNGLSRYAPGQAPKGIPAIRDKWLIFTLPGVSLRTLPCRTGALIYTDREMLLTEVWTTLLARSAGPRSNTG